MALSATLIAFAAGLAAKVRPPKDPLAPEVMRLLAESKKAATRIAQLERLVYTLDRELLTERNLKAHWREEARHLATQARERREARDWQAAQLNMAAQAQQANAQQMAMQAQLAAVGLLGPQFQQQAQAQGFQQLGQVAQNLLGAQNLQMNADWVCTCIPDRASALRRR
jgi:hypothetical protein